jgi:hypothetical protein
LLDSAILLFLKHNVCFRETDPLGGSSYLVFPELINLKKPAAAMDQRLDDDVSYVVIGAVQNVYASLVVLLGYTQTFTRTDQWQNQARYEVGDGLICGFRQESEQEGKLELVLYFGQTVGGPVRSLFKGLFESFLTRRNLSAYRYEPAQCENGHVLNRAVVRERSHTDDGFACCPTCGKKITISVAREPIKLTQSERGEVDEQEWFAVRRTRFEQAIFRLTSYVETKKISRPSCFISYAWGNVAHEKWVERDLAADLRKAGVNVILDKAEMGIGHSISRFIERIEKCDRVVVVGTPMYRSKYDNKESNMGYVVAAEVDLISNRLVGTEIQKESVLPVLLEGERSSSLPPLLHGRAFADFRDKRKYFEAAFDLIIGVYGIQGGDPAVSVLRRSLESLGKPDHEF